MSTRRHAQRFTGKVLLNRRGDRFPIAGLRAAGAELGKCTLEMVRVQHRRPISHGAIPIRAAVSRKEMDNTRTFRGQLVDMP